MLRDFEEKFGGTVEATLTCDDLESLREQAGDRTFGDGLYRVLSEDRAAALAPEIYRAFPDYADMAEPFATDWLGRVFAVRKDTQKVVMFEPGSAEALGIGVLLVEFHRDEMVNHTDALLAASFFDQWVEAGNDRPTPDQAVGYKKALFQGGTDALENLELIDLDVMWTVSAPFIAKARRALASH